MGPHPNGWALIREAIEERPQLIWLFALDVSLIFLADVLGFVLVLVAVAYSTWIVMPWAFYEKLKSRKADVQLKWLRRGEVLLFVSGTFLVSYAIADLIGQNMNLEIFISAILPFVRMSLLICGVILLFGGLYDSFRVVNFYASAEEPEHRLAFWGLIPFACFDLLVTMAFLLSYGTYFYKGAKMSAIGSVFFVAFVLALAGTFVAIAWVEHVPDLGRRVSLRGVVSLCLIVLPIVLLVSAWALGELGIRFFV